MDRPENPQWAGAVSLQCEELANEELRYAVEHVTRTGQCYRYHARCDDGHTEDVELVFFPEAGRAGISWRDGVWWLSARTPGEAVERWCEGEGRRSLPLRRWASGSAG